MSRGVCDIELRLAQRLLDALPGEIDRIRAEKIASNEEEKARQKALKQERINAAEKEKMALIEGKRKRRKI